MKKADKIKKAIEALEALRGGQEGGDPEMAHFKAEEILCAHLIATGSKEVVAAFERTRERVGFQYA